MATLVVREDPVEITGRIVSAAPPLTVPLVGELTTGNWTVRVKPDPEHQARLITRNGITNADGTIACTVGVDERVINLNQLRFLLSNAFNRHVRVVGTWCDDDDTSTTVIYPLGVLAAEYDMEVYDIEGWPVAVRDADLFASPMPEMLWRLSPSRMSARAARSRCTSLSRSARAMRPCRSHVRTLRRASTRLTH